MLTSLVVEDTVLKNLKQNHLEKRKFESTEKSAQDLSFKYLFLNHTRFILQTKQTPQTLGKFLA